MSSRAASTLLNLPRLHVQGQLEEKMRTKPLMNYRGLFCMSRSREIIMDMFVRVRQVRLRLVAVPYHLDHLAPERRHPRH